MDEFSIMVCLSGSEEAEQASRLAWSLARTADCPVVAEHVVDSSGPTWLLNKYSGEFIDRDELGFYHSTFRDSLLSIAEILKDKYQSLFSSQKLNGSCNVDYGNPVSKLIRKAINHNLVLIGNRQFEEPRVRGQVLGGLARNCPVPLIVVRKCVASLTRLAMLVSGNHLSPRYLRSCSNLASLLRLEPEIVCIGTEDEPPETNNLKTLVRKIMPELDRVKISSRLIDADCGSIELWTRTDRPVNLSAQPDILVVVPTMKIGQRRITILGEEVGTLLEHLEMNFVCLWPEEYRHEPWETTRLNDRLELSA